MCMCVFIYLHLYINILTTIQNHAIIRHHLNLKGVWVMTGNRDLTGTALMNIAMRLRIGEKVDVEYGTAKGARNAANGACNKRLMDGIAGVVVKRWTSIDNKFFVTVAKVGKHELRIENTQVSDMPESVAIEITNNANRNMIKGMLQEGYTTMDILEGIENWSEERSLSEIEAIKLALAEQPEM